MADLSSMSAHHPLGPPNASELRTGPIRLDTGTEWERRMAYSRAIRVGPLILVAGCLGVEADGRYATSMTRQTERALERIADALAEFGTGLNALVRVRIYTTAIHRWPEMAEAIEPRLSTIRPVNTLVEVRALAHPEALIEIDADAWAD